MAQDLKKELSLSNFQASTSCSREVVNSPEIGLQKK